MFYDHLRHLQFEQLEPRIVLDSTVVFNELMYHPADSDQSLEWIEVHSQLALDVDLTGWSIEGGVDYVFPDGTVMPADGYLLVAADPARLSASGIPNALGPYTGALSNGGEELRLVNNSGRRMDRLDYNDGGEGDDGVEWPVGPDGSGSTLAKLDEQWSSEDT